MTIVPLVPVGLRRRTERLAKKQASGRPLILIGGRPLAFRRSSAGALISVLFADVVTVPAGDLDNDVFGSVGHTLAGQSGAGGQAGC